MKILIFGNSGFIGSIIEKHLKSLGHEVCGVSRNGQSDFNLDISKEYEFNKIDFIPNVIVNSASILPSINSFDNQYVNSLCDVNIIGALNIVKWARINNVKEIYNLSTLAIHNKPWELNLQESINELVSGTHTAYGMSKIFQEKIMTEFLRGTDVKVYHLRLSSVYGVNMKKEGIIYSLLKLIETNSSIKITNGSKVSFDFLNSNDIAHIIGMLLNTKKNHSVYNLNSSEEIYLYELTKLLLNLKGKMVPIDNTDEIEFESRSVVDNSKIINDIKGYNFISLQDGLREILRN